MKGFGFFTVQHMITMKAVLMDTHLQNIFFNSSGCICSPVFRRSPTVTMGPSGVHDRELM